MKTEVSGFKKIVKRRRVKGRGRLRRDFKFTPPVLRGYNLRIALHSLAFLILAMLVFPSNLQIVVRILLCNLLSTLSIVN